MVGAQHRLALLVDPALQSLGLVQVVQLLPTSPVAASLEAQCRLGVSCSKAAKSLVTLKVSLGEVGRY